MKTLTPSNLCPAASALLLLALLAGCDRNSSPPPAPQVAAPAPAPAYAVAQPPPPAGEYYVEGDMPPPPSEVIVARPGPEFVWIGGYYGWNAGARVWMRGHWERPPHPRGAWVPARWERHGRGYVFVHGYWR